MQIDQSKLNRQLEAVQKWIDTGARGILEHCPGFGKSFETKLIIDRLKTGYVNRATLIIVPTIPLKEQWEEKIIEFGLENTKVLVINTAITKLDEPCDLLVLDEMHLYASEEFIKVFNIRHRFLLGLTATIDRLDGRHQLLLDKCPVVDTITLQEARKKGWISEYIEYNLELELTEEDRKSYDAVNTSFKKYFSKFNHDFKLAMGCVKKPVALQHCIVNAMRFFGRKHAMNWTIDAPYIVELTTRDPLNEKEEKLKKFYQWLITSEDLKQSVKMTILDSLQFNRYMRARKDFLYNTNAKLQSCINIIKKFQLKTIIYCQSTEFADELTKRLGSIAVCYHSKLKTQIIKGKKFGNAKLKKLAIEKFTNNEASVMVTVAALNQGIDIPDVKMVIISSYNRNSTSKTQRTGRGTRKFGDKIAIVINQYIKDSQDEKWLKECQTDPKTKRPSNPYIIKINNLDEINYGHAKSSTFSATCKEDGI